MAASTSKISPRRRWGNLFILAFGNTIDNADSGSIKALFPTIRASMNVDLVGLSLFSGVNSAARMAFGPLWAMAADRWNRKLILFIVTGLWGIWTILAGFAQDVHQLLILYAIASIGTVATEPVTSAIAADLFPAAQRGRAFGILRSLGSIGFVALPLVIGLFFSEGEGWRYALILMGGLSVLMGLLVIIFLKDPGRGASEAEGEVGGRFHFKDLRYLLKNKTVLTLAVSLILVTSATLVNFAPTYLVDIRHFSLKEANFILATIGAGFGIGAVLGGLLGDWTEKRWPNRGRIAFMQIYLVAYAVMSFLCLQLTWPHWAYYPLFFVFGTIAAFGFAGCVLPIISNVVLPELRSSAFGFLLSLLHGAYITIISLLIGYFGERFGLQAVVFWVSTVAYGANALLWFVMYRVYPKDLAKMHAVLRERATNKPVAVPAAT